MLKAVAGYWVPVIRHGLQHRPHILFRGHVHRRSRSASDLVVGQEVALNQVIAGAPPHENLGGNRIMVQRHLRPAGIGAGDEIGVKVPLAEVVDRDGVLL